MDIQYEIAKKLIFSKIHQALGLDQTKLKPIGTISGAAPLNLDTFLYFQSIDILIHELYGMSESNGAQTTNMAGNYFEESIDKFLKFTSIIYSFQFPLT